MRKIITVLAVLTCAAVCGAQESVERWGMYETAIKAAVKGNPFDVELSATFACGDEKMEVRGFYDGEDTYRIRFMPPSEGRWTYVTRSSVRALNGRKGAFTATAPLEGNHGPVVPDGLHFKYADGTRYYPVGTTSYDWMHVQGDFPQRTVASLKESGFNKVRMLFFLHNLGIEYPDIYPFEKAADGSWDYEHFNPAYFRYVEERIAALQEIGVEADLILFHPYDGGRWGFDRMPLEVNLRYLDYITARLGAFRNVWWSLANEFDGVKNIPAEDWDKFAAETAKGDPYRHMLSIHGYTATYYDYFDDVFTHTSIQDHAPVVDRGHAFTVRNIYKKPVIFDEVCYEGNQRSRWGWLSGEEMLRRMYNGLMCGTYVTHAECFNTGESEDFTNFLAFGGEFHGQSWRRIRFMREEILADLPNPLGLADCSWDFYTSTAGDGYYLIYFGDDIRSEWTFDLPVKNAMWKRPAKGQKFSVEVIDTWDMTVEKWPVEYELAEPGRYRVGAVQADPVRLPARPYMMLRIKLID